MKKNIILFALTIILSGCATAISPIAPKLISENISSSSLIGKIRETNIGHPMVVEKHLKYYEAYKVTNDYQPAGSFGVHKYSLIKTGMEIKPVGRLKNGDIVYGGSGLTTKLTGLLGETLSINEYCIVVNSLGEPYGNTRIGCEYEDIIIWSPKPPNFLEKTQILSTGSFMKELIYNGKTQANIIKIIYREYLDDLARSAFYQDLTYDLTESKVIRFKNMDIEVLDVNNLSIKFIIKSSMGMIE